MAEGALHSIMMILNFTLNELRSYWTVLNRVATWCNIIWKTLAAEMRIDFGSQVWWKGNWLGSSHSSLGKTQCWLCGGETSRDGQRQSDAGYIAEKRASSFFGNWSVMWEKVRCPEKKVTRTKIWAWVIGIMGLSLHWESL